MPFQHSPFHQNHNESFHSESVKRITGEKEPFREARGFVDSPGEMG